MPLGWLTFTESSPQLTEEKDIERGLDPQNKPPYRQDPHDQHPLVHRSTVTGRHDEHA
jgi:hypothetical protein